MRSFYKSIGFRLLVISIILLSIPLLVDSFIFLENRFSAATKQAKAHLLSEVNYRLFPIEQIQQQNKEIFRLIIHFLNLEAQFPSKESQSLNEELERLALLNHYQGLVLVKYTAEGKYQTVGTSLEAYKERDLTTLLTPLSPFSPAPTNNQVITALTIDPVTQSPFLLTVKPVYSPDGVPLGVLLVVDDFSSGISYLLRKSAGIYAVDFAFLLPSSVVFAATDPSLKFQYFHPLSSLEYQRLIQVAPSAQHWLAPKPLSVNKNNEKPYLDFLWNGKKHVGVVQIIPGTEIALLAYSSKQDIFASVILEFIVIYGTYLVIMGVGLVIAFFATRRVAQPINHLSDVMQQIEEGNLEAKYQPDRFGFEINQLGVFFNEMVQALINKRKGAEQERIKKETLSKELKLGQTVQRQLLPQVIPECPSVEIGHAFQPAIEVGGDFFDVFLKPDGQLVLTVADASGKGVHACLYSLMLKNTLRTLIEQGGDLYQVMKKTNNIFCDDTRDSGMFVTVFTSQYDPISKKFTYHSCGHNPMLIYKAKEQTSVFLNSADMAMGFMPSDTVGEAQTVLLQSGDIIVMYSDGVTEAHNRYQELFGEERLKRFIQLEAMSSAQQLVDKLMEELQLFAAGVKQHDDITLLILKIR